MSAVEKGTRVTPTCRPEDSSLPQAGSQTAFVHLDRAMEKPGKALPATFPACCMIMRCVTHPRKALLPGVTGHYLTRAALLNLSHPLICRFLSPQKPPKCWGLTQE